MTEFYKIVLTSSLTIAGGVIIYTIGQIISKFFIDPIYEQKKVIAEIVDTLVFYANIFGNFTQQHPRADEAVDKVRSLSTRLRARTSFIPFYRLFEKLKIVLPKEDIATACRSLIGLSNSVYRQDSQVFELIALHEKTISKALKIQL